MPETVFYCAQAWALGLLAGYIRWGTNAMTDRGYIVFDDGRVAYAKPREAPCICTETQQCAYHALLQREAAAEREAK